MLSGSAWYLPSSETIGPHSQQLYHRNGSHSSSVDEREGDSGFSDGATTPASGDDSQEAFMSGGGGGGVLPAPTPTYLGDSSPSFSLFPPSSSHFIPTDSSLNPVTAGADQTASSAPTDLVPLDADILDVDLPDSGSVASAGLNPDAIEPSFRPDMDPVPGPSADIPVESGRNGPDDDDDNLSVISGISDLSGADWKPSAGPFSWVQSHMMKGTDPRELLKDMISSDSVIPDHLDQLTLWKIILNMVSEPPRRKKLPNINTLDDVVDLIRTSRKIIILTGAGVSVSCGIPDFRSRDGVYARLAVDFPDLPDPQVNFETPALFFPRHDKEYFSGHVRHQLFSERSPTFFQICQGDLPWSVPALALSQVHQGCGRSGKTS